MSATFDCSDTAGLLEGMRAARGALGRGELVVAPTDTVYGVAADAFQPAAVQALLDAKGRTRQSPPPVLVPDALSLESLALGLPDEVRALTKTFWPGGLTVIVNAQPSLDWDLGETFGTVALRMPDNPIMLALLRECGPLAVSSANLHDRPSATNLPAAHEMLGDSVAVYLDGGPTPGSVASTIVDASLFEQTGTMHIVRHGVLGDEQIRAVIGDVLVDENEA